ncbi:uncharacterized protein BO95DRAFT_433785 [Aspergillus brunneoviolaceus CBS 621.78]|uniref:Uncharacterized protein n=1 Tax=Aspergillus brunneoviolaceus CBS 621.78 TaxID=1450534 RepID=A0ACD1G2T2_9EURO|nr:hypothetical protein BO95DRAFT_433785 [Aspergillus brunneoviolaceus CBS 621.78]RAH43574.1 hypothetical protein BO95DRAFT_433785 [Aspergillus brunneoviolaceus CBS 621.78]
MTIAHSEQDEYNLQEAWDRVCTSFMQTTHADLKTAPTKYTIEEVLDQIRAKQDEVNEKNAKYQELKTVMNKTLTFVGLLGGIAAQGASMVFAPSSLCFNAVAYLINTGARYKRVFSSLAELFRKVSDMLDRLQIYMRVPPDAVDIALRRIINDQLLCFVDICALSIKVLKRHKVLITIKVFAFGEDEGVSGQLARLESLVERESQMRATLGIESQKISERGILETKEGTKKINVTVTEILDLEKKRDTDQHTKKELEDLDRTLDRPSESWRSSRDTPKDFPELNQLTRAYCLLCDEKDFHDILFTLARTNIETFDMACNHYRMSIAHATDQCVKAKEAGDDEWAEVQQGRQGTLMYYHALLRYEHANQDVASRMNAIEEWERLWQMEHTDPLEHVYYAVRRRLPLAYFHEAQQQQQSERTEALWLTKLEQLAELSTAEYLTWADKQYPARLLARYHALRGDLGKAQAVLRAHVKIGLDILSDTDPLNDPDGYFRLAFHFMLVDLDDEALAAWSMIVPKLLGGATGDKDVQNGKLEGPLQAQCDGKCGTTWSYANDFYVCKECQNVQFDRACLERLRQGTLELCDVCAPDHEMLYVPAYDPARRERVGEGNIQVGSEPAMSVDEWVARTRQYWGIKS